MIIVETFEPGCQPRLSPSPAIGFDSSWPARSCRHPTLPPRFRPISHRRRPPPANRNCQRRLRPPKGRALTTRPPFRSCARRPNPTPRWLLTRRPCSKPKDQGTHRR